MKDLVKYSNLLDFYRNLFTKTQLKYLDAYFYHDMSLQEIADANKVSRAAIHDVIMKAQKQLEDFEDKLHLFDKELKRKEIYKEINDKNLVDKLRSI